MAMSLAQMQAWQAANPGQTMQNTGPVADTASTDDPYGLKAFYTKSRNSYFNNPDPSSYVNGMTAEGAYAPDYAQQNEQYKQLLASSDPGAIGQWATGAGVSLIGSDAAVQSYGQGMNGWAAGDQYDRMRQALGKGIFISRTDPNNPTGQNLWKPDDPTYGDAHPIVGNPANGGGYMPGWSPDNSGATFGNTLKSAMTDTWGKVIGAGLGIAGGAGALGLGGDGLSIAGDAVLPGALGADGLGAGGLASLGGGAGANSLLGGAAGDTLGAGYDLGGGLSVDEFGNTTGEVFQGGGANAFDGSGLNANGSYGSGLSLSDLSRLPTGTSMGNDGSQNINPYSADNPFSTVPTGGGSTASNWLAQQLGIDPGLLDLLGKGGTSLLGMLGANQKSSAIKDLMDKQDAERAPFRNAANAALSPDWYKTPEGMASTDAVLRSLSVGGNPAANPGLLSKAAALSMGAQNARIGALGGLALGGQGTQAQLGLAGANAAGDAYGAAGFGLGALTQKTGLSAEDILKKFATIQPDGTIKIQMGEKGIA